MVHPLKSATSRSVHAYTSNLQQLTSIRSEIRDIDPNRDIGDEELLAQIGYKQELDRHYSTLQVFGISFSIMGLLPSIASIMSAGLESGPVGLVWGWFVSGLFILCTGASLTVLGSAIPTSGGLYYYTNYFAPENIGIPLSFVIGCSNSIGLCGGICSIAFGFATEVLAAVALSRDGDFNITYGMQYGVFAACVISNVIICCLTTKHTATLQSVSIALNLFLIALFFIAVPIGASKTYGFNDGHFIFAKLENYRDWNTGWSFMIAWIPAMWTICSFDSVIHCSEEAKNAQRAIPIGILGSIATCWILGWFICIVCCAVIKDGDVDRLLNTSTGNLMAQIVYDSLGRKWAVAFMSLIAVGQYLMSCSIFIAASRQIWAFARDDGLPVVYNFVKVVNPKIKVPIRATIFAGIISLIIGLLVLIGPAGSSALFSLGITSIYFSWGVPVLMVLLPTGQARFKPGKFYFGKFWTNTMHWVTVLWIVYAIIMNMFPNDKAVDLNSMNYTVVINVGIWLLSLLYYYVHGYKVYVGPKSNLEDPLTVLDGELDEYENIDAIAEKI